MPYFGIPIRNGLPIGLGSVAGFGVAPFDPSQLFSAGEQGAWYDPSDFTTLFEDAAGTLPITSIGAGSQKFVGLMLDKSKGLVLGSDISLVSSTTVSSTGNTTLVSSAPATSFYQISFSATGLSASDRIRVTTSSPLYIGSYITVDGAYSFILPANASGNIRINRDIASGPVNITNISVRELPGNHATSSGTNRPELSARYNLLTYTEQFDNGAWVKGPTQGIDVNDTTAPNGTTTADLIKDNNAGGTGLLAVYQNPTLSANTSYTFLVYLKDAARTQYAAIRTFSFDASANGYTYVNLTNGSIVSSDPAHTASAPIDAGNGWYLFAITVTLGADNTGAFAVYASQNGTNTTVDLDNTSGFYIWGADLRPASQATGLIGPTYQRVADANTYDTAGFLPYLKFDGIDDSMSTGSIDFTATDKMTVWAGVRKLSDAARGVVAELSNNDANSFQINAPSAVAPLDNFAFASRGSNFPGFAQASGYSAPISGVLTGIGQIDTDTNVLRVNGSQVATNVVDQGTGNYGNYPLYIGERGGAFFPFNGWLTSLIIRGAQSTQSQIEATEAWVNGKTGAY